MCIYIYIYDVFSIIFDKYKGTSSRGHFTLSRGKTPNFLDPGNLLSRKDKAGPSKGGFLNHIIFTFEHIFV